MGELGGSSYAVGVRHACEDRPGREEENKKVSGWRFDQGFDSLLLLPLSFQKWLLRFFAKAMSSSTTPTATLDEFKVTSIWLTSISAAADLPNDTKLEVH